MTSTIRLGRIAGIEIGINWTWLVVFGLIVWTWATGVFPDAVPGRSDAVYWAMAIVASLLFFSSLLLHELGHALQARREGMQIDGITLWLLGGVAKFRGVFPGAGAEFRIAIAGPLVSLVLGAALVAAALVYSGSDPVDTVLAWIGEINIILLIFNLLPALPLDGGRVLRSALWAIRGDFAFATRIAASIGRAFGALFILGGLALAFFSTDNRTDAIWIALLGWFLFSAASSEAQAGQVYAALAGRRVGDLMVRQPATVAPDQTIGELMDGMIWTNRHAAYAVVDDGRPVGLLPFEAIAAVPRQEWDARRVRETMIPVRDVAVLREDDPLDQALGTFNNVSDQALVVNGDRLTGVLSAADVARTLQRR
jgi:Zn-dependent protease/CBS domain-containing protein